MAIYHLSAKLIKRSEGRSSVAASAYRAGCSLHDERTGLTHDFSKKSRIDHIEIFLPDNAPKWMADRSQLWNAVEVVEKRKDAQLAREIEVAIPKELKPYQMRELVSNFAYEEFVERGMVADIAWHNLDGANPHAHILLTTRTITGEGFGKKNRDWNGKDFLQKWRKSWEKEANRQLRIAGSDERISAESLLNQGIESAPSEHLGWQLSQIKKEIEQQPGSVTFDVASGHVGEDIAQKIFPKLAQKTKIAIIKQLDKVKNLLRNLKIKKASKRLTREHAQQIATQKLKTQARPGRARPKNKFS